MIQMRTRPVGRAHFRDYLKRAEECLHALQMAYEHDEWNACVINAIHCMIAAADAFCVYRLGTRHAGERHDDAVALFASSDPSSEEVKANARRLSRVLGVKNNAEYGEKLMGRKDAEEAKRDAERFVAFVKSRTEK